MEVVSQNNNILDSFEPRCLNDTLNPLMGICLVPAAAVIPASIARIKVVAVSKIVIGASTVSYLMNIKIKFMPILDRVEILPERFQSLKISEPISFIIM